MALVVQPTYGANSGGPVDMYADLAGRGIPGMNRADKPAPAYTGWQNSYTYNSPMGGTYQSPWSPDYLASLNPSSQKPIGGGGGTVTTPYGSLNAPGGYGNYSIPSFSQFAGTDLNSLLGNMANLKMKVQAPSLAEQAREYDLQNQLASLQANYGFQLGQGQNANQAAQIANALTLGQGQLGLGYTQAQNALTLGQGQIANDAARIAADLQVQLGVNANTAQQIANNFVLGNKQAANELTLGLGANANAAQQILNNYALGQGQLGIQQQQQNLAQQQYSDAASRQNALQQWLFSALNTPTLANLAASSLAGGYRP